MLSSPPPHTSFFQGQKNVSINGSYIEQTINVSSNTEPGISILLKAASLSAAHDASDRDPPPRCAKGTREKVIKDIMGWATNPSPKRSVMWLNGPFGNGKSAVMQTIADRLRDDSSLNHVLAASFFFGRSKPGRDKAKYLIPTIAYQIAIGIPSMRQLINNALIQDPTILSKSIDAQLRYLITNPLRELASPSFHTPTVLIDGLDECEGHDFQRAILKAIFAAVLKDHIPLRFLIASRPEPQIGETFRTPPSDQHHYSITLLDDYQTRQELRRFLSSGFDEMCQRRLDLVSVVERPWPSEDDLRTLIDRASGQFLYASTILKFVDSDIAHPTRQLSLILRSQSSNAFSNMDDLYTQVLESCPCQEFLPSFLHSLVFRTALESKYYRPSLLCRPTLANYSAISGLHPDDFSVIVRWLPAIVEVEQLPSPQSDLPDDWPLQQIVHLYSPELFIHHQSFVEFITDYRRSGKFHVDLDFACREMKAHLDFLVAMSLSHGEQSPRIHQSTWDGIDALLYQDLGAHGLGPSLGWPRLQKTLNDFKEGRIPRLSEPCPEFLDALRHVLHALKNFNPNPKDHIIQEITAILTDMYDRSFLLTISPNAKIWKIAGALALAPVLSKRMNSQDFESGWTSYDHYIDELPQLTGLPLATVLRILEENWNFFDVDISGYPFPKTCLWEIDMQHHEAFLRDEARARDLYVAYRNSALGVLKFTIQESKSAQQLSLVFTSFCAHGWDIRINEDLRDGSVMRDVIDLLLENNPIMQKSLTEESPNGFDYTLHSTQASSYVPLQWLVKQLHNLLVISNPNHAATTMIQHLRYIIDRSKEDAIILSLEQSRRLYRYDPKAESLPNNEVMHSDVLDDGRWDERSTSIRNFFSDISFLLSGISAECHASILRYHLYALVSWIFFLIEGWSLPVDEDETRGLDDQFESKLDGVQWEYHLSNADAFEPIHDQLLTIHYLIVVKEYDDRVKTGALRRLPTSLVRGGLAWFRKHYEPNVAFETWCEEVLATRAEVCPSSTAFRNIIHVPPQSSSVSPVHDLTGISSATPGSILSIPRPNTAPPSPIGEAPDDPQLSKLVKAMNETTVGPVLLN